MAERNEQVLEFVRRELARQPDLRSRPLYDQAKEIDPAIGELTPNQFQGSYYLPIKREQAPKQKKAAPARKVAGKAKAEAEPKPSRTPAARKQEEPAEQAQPAGDGQGPDREQVRSLFLQFARDFAEAESRSEIVGVLSKVDEYVDQVVGQKR